MSYLYHWRKENYQTDPGMDKDPPFEHGICLNSKNKLFSDIDYGDVIYAFSRRDDARPPYGLWPRPLTRGFAGPNCCDSR